jgi:arylsulfatase A
LESRHRILIIACWPGKIPAVTTSDELISNVDLLATKAVLVNRPLKKVEGPDSCNVLPAHIEPPQKPIRDHLVISPFQKKDLAIRQGNWMYISSEDGGGFGGAEIDLHDLSGAAATLLPVRLTMILKWEDKA